MRTILKAIETHYAGRRFRSRLEARWAVFFDTAGISWQYEPQGYDNGRGFRYLPDFYLPKVENGVFFEVKGEEPKPEYVVDVTQVLPRAVVFAVGDFPGELTLRVFDRVSDHIFALGVTFAQEPYYLFGSFRNHELHKLQPDAVRAARSARFEHGETP